MDKQWVYWNSKRNEVVWSEFTNEVGDYADGRHNIINEKYSHIKHVSQLTNEDLKTIKRIEMK